MQFAKRAPLLYKLSPTVLLITSFVGYLLIAVWFPLFPFIDQVPQYDIRLFAPSLWEAGGYALLLTGLFLCYGLLSIQIQQRKMSAPVTRQILATICFSLPLLFTYPINSTDIYRYIIRGRVNSVYGMNQFEVPPNAIVDDPFVAFAGEWANETSPYGPVWEIMATAVTTFSGDQLWLGILIFKLMALALHLAIGWLIWLANTVKSTVKNDTSSWLWLGNPALLLTFVANGHNDALMLFWGVFAFYLFARNRPFLALLFGMMTPLSKPIGLLILPFLGLAILRHAKDWSQRLKIILFSIFMFLIITALAFLPFGSPLDLVQRLGRELSSGAGFSIVALSILLTRLFSLPISFDQTIIFFQVLFVIVALLFSWRVLNGRSALRHITYLFAGYLAQAANFRIWYASWLLPWLLVEQKKNFFWLKTAVFFLFTSQLSVLIYGHLRVLLLSGDLLLSHLIGILFTFGLPFVMSKTFTFTPDP